MFRQYSSQSTDEEQTQPLLARPKSQNNEEPLPDIIELHVHDGYQTGEGVPARPSGKWYGVKDLDRFLSKVYYYYTNKGFWPTILKKTFNLIQMLFVAMITTVIVGGVDYSVLLTTYDFSRALSFKGMASMHPMLVVVLVVFGLFWLWEVVSFLAQVPSLIEIRAFYREALMVPESEMETLLWHEVVRKLIDAQKVHRYCRVKAEITEHDIANRLMRRENFLIALFNKDILPMEIHIPLLGYKLPFLPQSLEWSINKCVLDYVFDYQHRISDQFLQEDRGDRLALGLTRRFRHLAAWSMVMAPFMLGFQILYFFFRYAEECRRDPRVLAMRHWSAHLRWKAREFNELPHIFHRRLSLAYTPAEDYLNSFTSETLIATARFTAFITGSCVALLMFLTLYDEQFLQVHISPDRSVLWYLGVLGAILALARSQIPDEHSVCDPDTHMTQVVCHLHYIPEQWKHKFHTVGVKQSFGRLFEYKAMYLMSELVGVFITPVLLWTVMPRYSRNIIEFFRHLTVYRDGVGHVCSFALFDFKRHGNTKYGVPLDQPNVPSPNEQTVEGKMEKSFLNFKTHHPDWLVPPEGQGLLDTLDEFSQQLYQDQLQASMVSNPASRRTTGPARHPQWNTQRSIGGQLRPPGDGNEMSSGHRRQHPIGTHRPMRRGCLNPELIMDGASIHEATHTIATTSQLLNEDEALGTLGMSTLIMDQLYDYRCEG